MFEVDQLREAMAACNARSIGLKQSAGTTAASKTRAASPTRSRSPNMLDTAYSRQLPRHQPLQVNVDRPAPRSPYHASTLDPSCQMKVKLRLRDQGTDTATSAMSDSTEVSHDTRARPARADDGDRRGTRSDRALSKRQQVRDWISDDDAEQSDQHHRAERGDRDRRAQRYLDDDQASDRRYGSRAHGNRYTDHSATGSADNVTDATYDDDRVAEPRHHRRDSRRSHETSGRKHDHSEYRQSSDHHSDREYISDGRKRSSQSRESSTRHEDRRRSSVDSVESRVERSHRADKARVKYHAGRAPIEQNFSSDH